MSGGSVDAHKGATKKRAAAERLAAARAGEVLRDLVRISNRAVRRQAQLRDLATVLESAHLSDPTKRFFASWRAWLEVTPGACLSAAQEQVLAVKASLAARLAAGGARVLSSEEHEAMARERPKRRKASFVKHRTPLAAFFSDPSLLPKKPPTRRTS